MRLQLQINTAGAWRTMVKLDLKNIDQSAKAMRLGTEMAELFDARLRTCTDDGSQTVLSNWNDRKTGWVDTPNFAAFKG